MSRLAVTATFALGALAASARTAIADRPDPSFVYGALTAEAAMAGTFYLNFSDLADHVGESVRLPVGFVATLGGPFGVGYLAYRTKPDPRPGLIVHGAAWYAFDGFLLGTLIDGRDQAWGLRIGPTAWTLGALGLVGGGVLGARYVDGRDESVAWFAAPVGGFVAGGIGLGGLLVLLGGVDGDTASGQFVTGATVGLTVGLGAATALAIRGFGDTSPARRQQLARLARYLPRVAASPERVLLTVGGRF